MAVTIISSPLIPSFFLISFSGDLKATISSGVVPIPNEWNASKRYETYIPPFINGCRYSSLENRLRELVITNN